MNDTARAELEKRLHDRQSGKCFICDDAIDLVLHQGQLDIDHIEPRAEEGSDDENNLALTHATCNRSKGASDRLLQIAREGPTYLYLPRRLTAKCCSPTERQAFLKLACPMDLGVGHDAMQRLRDFLYSIVEEVSLTLLLPPGPSRSCASSANLFESATCSMVIGTAVHKNGVSG